MHSSKFFSGYQPYHGVSLGGCNEDGSDAVNELSYMALKATANTRMHAPTLNVRVNKNTSDEFLMAVADLVELGTGQPAIFFDETASRYLKGTVSIKKIFGTGALQVVLSLRYRVKRVFG